ncbi:MAG: TonB-dependent receptor plug domain-containing protein [Eudoraea sp.]|nr:TonB-dependent receptor plug domain-containing protein [Eudoraea sp.]
MSRILFITALIFFFIGCGPSKSTSPSPPAEKETMEQKNRVTISLINRIRQLPGIVVRGGVPVFNKLQTDISGNFVIQPLYVLDGYAVGNSFTDINRLVQSFNVKKIEGITGPDTSIYGSRGGGGVIKITTFQ